MNNMLVEHGYFAGVSKSKYREALRANSNLTAVADIYDRVTGAQSVFYDILDGTNDHSAGLMDTTATTITVPTVVGETVLDPHVASTTGFVLGQEITIQDDVNKEYTTITRAETVATPTVYDRSTPVTVVASAYTTSASARPQVLSNGWVVSASQNSTTSVQLSVSKDNGITFANLVYFNGNMTCFSLASKGTTFTLLIAAGPYVYSCTYDATAITSGNPVYTSIPIPLVTVDTAQTSGSITSCSMAIDSTGTYLHATWSSKNATYPNSFNIRYCKGTIAGDGSVSWGGVTQISSLNGAGFNMSQPSITILSNGNPYIANVYEHTVFWKVVYWVYNGSSWNTHTGAEVIYNSGSVSYAQSSPDIICDRTGVLWCSWYGKDTTDANYDNIHCKYSTDNGVNWLDGGITGDKITNGNLYSKQKPSITSDKDGKIYIMFQGVDSASAGTSNIMRIIRNGSSWGSVTKLTSSTISSIDLPSTCNKYTDFTDPICVYRDGQATAVKFRGIFTVTTNISHLEVTALQNTYKVNALVYRSLGTVDTVAKRLKFSTGFTAGTAFNVTTPTTVSSSYGIGAQQGGKKIVRLSNGWFVVVTWNMNNPYSLYLYKSTDNGVTWSQLCYVASASSIQTNHALTSYGNNVTVIARSDDTSALKSWTFDASTQANVNIYSNGKSIYTGYYDLESCCSVASDSSGKLWATFIYKETSGIASFNLGVCNSIDGGASWSGVTKLTTYNTSGESVNKPTIAINGSNQPVIIYQRANSSTSTIFSHVYNGSTWTQYTIYNSESSTYGQQDPSSVVDSSGVIHLVWLGRDSTNTAQNVIYSKSIDGGVTWSSRTKLTTGSTNAMGAPNITYNSNNLYVMFIGVTEGYIVKQVAYSGSSWGVIQNLGINAYNLMSCANYSSFNGVNFIYSFAASTQFAASTGSGYVCIPLLSEDLRYNITPATGTTPEIDSWIQYEQDAGFSVDSKISIVATGATEVYGTPAKTTYIAGEDQYIYYASARGARATERITITRTVGTLDKAVTRVLGAVIA